MVRTSRAAVVLAVACLAVTAPAATVVAQTDGETDGPTSFEVSDLEAPGSFGVGENVTVSANVTNPNANETTQAVEFRFRGRVIERTNVTLAGVEATTVRFEASTEGIEPGEYVYGVLTRDAGELSTIRVGPPEEPEPSFDVTNLTAPTGAAAGETVEVSATITSPNPNETGQDVEFRLDGDVVERQNVTVPANGSTDVTFELNTTGLEPGLYSHGVLTREFGDVASLFVSGRSDGTDGNETATVTFENQTSDGTSVVVQSASLSEGGFVAIYNASALDGNATSLLDGNATEDALGVSEYLEPANATNASDGNVTGGNATNVTVTLDANLTGNGTDAGNETLTGNQTLYAVAHRDSNDNRTFEFVTANATDDGPYLAANGSVVADDAVVTFENATNASDGNGDGDEADGTAALAAPNR